MNEIQRSRTELTATLIVGRALEKVGYCFGVGVC